MNTEAPEILLAHYLKALKLPTFQREHQKLARLCATEGVDHVGYLFRLAERETIERDRRKVVSDQLMPSVLKFHGMRASISDAGQP